MTDDFCLQRWLRARPDRCSLCGNHTRTQGHRKDCPLYPHQKEPPK